MGFLTGWTSWYFLTWMATKDDSPRCRLSQLPERVFNGLSKLYRLWLRNNSLTLLPAKLFHGLDSL